MLTDSYNNSLFDKNYMWSEQQTHSGFDVFNPYIEKNSRETTNLDTISVDDKSVKEELIQAATNRLRQRLLEQRFESFITQVVELQSRLEMIKIDTTSSIKCMGAIENLSEQQFDIFEKRLDTHKEDLDIFLSRKRIPTTNVLKKNDQKESSLSCLSKASFSSLSSMFLSQKSSLSEEESEYDHLGTKPRLRRRKRQQLKRLYENSSTESSADDSSIWSDSIPEYHPPPPPQKDNGQTSIKPFPFDIKTSTLTEEGLDSTSADSIDSVKDLPIHPYEFHVDCNTILSSAVSRTSRYHQRNALDDALSFLNDLASDADDGGFGDDIYKLLDLRHSFTPPLHTKQPNFILSAIESCICGSLKWFNFLLVMSVAVAIALRRGPSDLSCNTSFQHQMFMNKVW